MDQRKDLRVSVRPACKARFLLAGESFINVRVVNLGSHGCCFVIPEPAVNRFKAGPILEDWKLIHPKLPKATIKAKVMWCRHQGKNKPGLLEAGVQFLDVPSSYREVLDHFITAPARSKPKPPA
jgi:c-di-GMP-binding flagellar brake protein YcgR